MSSELELGSTGGRRDADYDSCQLPKDDEGLQLLNQFALSAAEIHEQALAGGETLPAIDLFGRAIQKMQLSDEQLLKLWAVLGCSHRAAQQQAEPESG